MFGDRYHDEVLDSPSRVRRALHYVLQNAKRHGLIVARELLDMFSSEVWFSGYSTRCAPSGRAWQRQRSGLEAMLGPDPCSIASTWLLSRGWRRSGSLQQADPPAASGCRRSEATAAA